MRDFGFFKELGFDGDLSIEDYKYNKLLIEKEILLNFLQNEGEEWWILKVVDDPYRKNKYNPSGRRLENVRWCNYLVYLIEEKGIYPPEELQVFINDNIGK